MNTEELINTYITIDKGTDRARIANAISDKKISIDDLNYLIPIFKEKEYFWESSFAPEKDKSKWTLEYEGHLIFKSIDYFSESYLRHLYEVTHYVEEQKNKKKEFKKRLLYFVGFLILLLIIVMRCSSPSANNKQAVNQKAEASTNGK